MLGNVFTSQCKHLKILGAKGSTKSYKTLPIHEQIVQSMTIGSLLKEFSLSSKSLLKIVFKVDPAISVLNTALSSLFSPN